jgi:hypothetical protein
MGGGGGKFMTENDRTHINGLRSIQERNGNK